MVTENGNVSCYRGGLGQAPLSGRPARLGLGFRRPVSQWASGASPLAGDARHRFCPTLPVWHWRAGEPARRSLRGDSERVSRRVRGEQTGANFHCLSTGWAPKYIGAQKGANYEMRTIFQGRMSAPIVERGPGRARRWAGAREPPVLAARIDCGPAKCQLGGRPANNCGRESPWRAPDRLNGRFSRAPRRQAS